MSGTAASALARVRRLALALPETSERPSHGMPTFFVREKTTFATFADHHHGDPRVALWLAGAPGAQAALIGAASERFFRPPYVGHRGWIGVVLDGRTDWDEVAGLIDEAFAHVAPAKIAALLTPRVP